MRGLIEEKYFTANAAKIFGSTQGADGQLDAVTWQLSNEVTFVGYTIAQQAGDLILYAIKTVGSLTFCSVTVFFTLEPDGSIRLRDILA